MAISTRAAACAALILQIMADPLIGICDCDCVRLAVAGGDTGSLRDSRGSGSDDSYKVLLIDDARYTEKLVEKALPQVMPSVIIDAARQPFHESRQKGAALVIVAVSQEHAEFYAQMKHGSPGTPLCHRA